MPNHYLKLKVLKLHLFYVAKIHINSNDEFKDSETAYLFELVNNTNLFLKISDL